MDSSSYPKALSDCEVRVGDEEEGEEEEEEEEEDNAAAALRLALVALILETSEHCCRLISIKLLRLDINRMIGNS